MKLRIDQLHQHLQKSLAPIYIVSGDEPLQIQEASDAIRATAKSKAYNEREVLTVNAKFDWNTLHHAKANRSLFSSRQLLELRLPTGKPGQAGAKALIAYAENPSQDKCLLIISGKIDGSTQKTKWFKSLESKGMTIPVWPISSEQLPRWLAARMQTKSIQTSPEGLQLLANYCEGNLLAAAQEIEKLELMHGAGQLSTEQIAAAITSSNHFNVFDLVNAILEKKQAKILTILQNLQAEGLQTPIVLWALTRELRILAALAFDQQHGVPPEQSFRENRIWDTKKMQYQQALRGKSEKFYYALLRQAKMIDEMIKGMRHHHNSWDALLNLSLKMSGCQPFVRKARHAQ